MEPVKVENPKVRYIRVEGKVVSVEILLRDDVYAWHTQKFPQSKGPDLLIDVDHKKVPIAITIMIPSQEKEIKNAPRE